MSLADELLADLEETEADELTDLIKDEPDEDEEELEPKPEIEEMEIDVKVKISKIPACYRYLEIPISPIYYTTIGIFNPRIVQIKRLRTTDQHTDANRYVCGESTQIHRDDWQRRIRSRISTDC